MIARTVQGRFYSLVVFSLAFFTLMGCASGPTLDNVNLSWLATKRLVISNLPTKLKVTSTNGHENTSEFYTISAGGVATPIDEDKHALVPERYFAFVTILGESRPYTLDVRVYKQTLRGSSHINESSGKSVRGGVYSSAKLDLALSKALVQKYKLALANRREDLNVIDDFHAF